ncbi:hypothetical protein J6590_020311 [Homalodisca vitripennis]|nr:hypothetical protein J6590_020311 [Homalodisca vitripennis]
MFVVSKNYREIVIQSFARHILITFRAGHSKTALSGLLPHVDILHFTHSYVLMFAVSKNYREIVIQSFVRHILITFRAGHSKTALSGLLLHVDILHFTHSYVLMFAVSKNYREIVIQSFVRHILITFRAGHSNTALSGLLPHVDILHFTYSYVLMFVVSKNYREIVIQSFVRHILITFRAGHSKTALSGLLPHVDILHFTHSYVLMFAVSKNYREIVIQSFVRHILITFRAGHSKTALSGLLPHVDILHFTHSYVLMFAVSKNYREIVIQSFVRHILITFRAGHSNTALSGLLPHVDILHFTYSYVLMFVVSKNYREIVIQSFVRHILITFRAGHSKTALSGLLLHVDILHFTHSYVLMFAVSKNYREIVIQSFTRQGSQYSRLWPYTRDRHGRALSTVGCGPILVTDTAGLSVQSATRQGSQYSRLWPYTRDRHGRALSTVGCGPILVTDTAGLSVQSATRQGSQYSRLWPYTRDRHGRALSTVGCGPIFVTDTAGLSVQSTVNTELAEDAARFE